MEAPEELIIQMKQEFDYPENIIKAAYIFCKHNEDYLRQFFYLRLFT